MNQSKSVRVLTLDDRLLGRKTQVSIPDIGIVGYSPDPVQDVRANQSTMQMCFEKWFDQSQAVGGITSQANLSILGADMNPTLIRSADGSISYETYTTAAFSSQID